MDIPYQKIAVILLTLFAVFTACHAVLHKRDSRAGFGWVVTSLVFIGIGPFLYWLFGINRIRTHAKKLHRLGHWSHRTVIEREKWKFGPDAGDSFYAKQYGGLLNVSEKVNRHPLMTGNRIRMLRDGEEAYPTMLKAIENAKDFIYLCTYIFDADEKGREFVEALSAARKRGVKVWVLVDGFGEYYSIPRIGSLLKRAGIKVARFLPPALSLNNVHFNLRNHRKILVVDGEAGFTGGMNIRGRRCPKDIHFEVRGPVVLELQEVFLEDWYFATRESLPWQTRPHQPLPGSSACRVVSGGPNEDFEKINWILLGAMACAQKSVQIMTPYFVPDRVMIYALNTTALRNVNVEILLPEKNNLPFVAWASRALFWEMLQNGVKFYYRPPPFSHGKLFVVDHSYALVGSSNWDARSLRLNFELDLEIYDPTVAGELADYFSQVRSQSRPVTLEEVKKDPLPIQFRNSLFKLFSPYL